MGFKVVVDFDKCESNALCMGVAPDEEGLGPEHARRGPPERDDQRGREIGIRVAAYAVSAEPQHGAVVPTSGSTPRSAPLRSLRRRLPGPARLSGGVSVGR